MKTRLSILTAAVFCLAGASAFGDTLNFGGNTTGAAAFNRPTEPGDQLSEIGSGVPFYAQPFVVSQSGGYNLSVNASDPANFDTFMHLYSGAFNPAAPLDSILLGNDDAVGGSPQFGSALFGQPLIAGNVYLFVISGFGNGDFGEFTASISGPGSVAVPEPSAIALAAAGFGLWRLRRRRAARA